ncbi:hypothetical protein ACI3EW_01015 [Pilosibacter sp. HC1M1C21]|uniref:hypothetical protein n=1 Tax=Pilosibacter sp. HC1M1C21 TaxID=3378803 RepID=UPI00385A05AB
MKKQTLHPIMIALLALFVLLQAFCLTAFGAENPEVCIPAGTDTETVNQILTETLLPDSEDTLEWEYECVGKEDGGLLKNTAWGSVGGFESTTKKYFVTHTYIHPALADNADGEYKVRTGEKKFTIRKTAKPTVDCELLRDQEIPLIYDEDGTLNAEETKEEIFTRVFSASNAEFITCDDVTIQYYGKAESGSVGNLGKNWVALDGETVNLLTYPAIPAGKQKIRILWDGNEEYSGFEKETDVTMTEREQMKFNLKEAPYEVGLVFDHDQNIDYTATAKAIYEAVVESTEPEVDFDEFEVKYNADPSGLIENFKPLDDESLVTKKFGPGSWKIRISWGGSRNYAPGSVTVSVAVTDNRINSKVVLKSEISFTYNKDVEAVKQAVLDNVIDWENSELPEWDTLSVDDFTFSYNARLSLLDGLSSELGDSFADKFLNGEGIRDDVPFEGKSYELGGKVLGSFPQIGAGEQKIKVTFKGNSEYRASEEAEGSVTINKANVKVSVNSASRYVSEAVKGGELVSTDPEDQFNLYIIYAGITSNVTTGVYLELPEQYTSNSTVIKIVDKALESLNQPTLTEMLQNGITVGELRKLLNASEVIDVLEELNVKSSTDRVSHSGSWEFSQSITLSRTACFIASASLLYVKEIWLNTTLLLIRLSVTVLIPSALPRRIPASARKYGSSSFPGRISLLQVTHHKDGLKFSISKAKDMHCLTIELIKIHFRFCGLHYSLVDHFCCCSIIDILIMIKTSPTS